MDGHIPDMVKTCYVSGLIVTVGRKRIEIRMTGGRGGKNDTGGCSR